jgi:hypothetical protein
MAIAAVAAFSRVARYPAHYAGATPRKRKWYFTSMTSRIIYKVVPRNDEWHVVKGRANECEGRFKHKPDAVEFGRFLAMRESVAELRVAKLDGSIQSEFTFGKDPQEVEG